MSNLPELKDLPSEACPTVREVRTILGLGRRAMKLYIGKVEKDHRIHPDVVLSIANRANKRGRLKSSFDEIASSLIDYTRDNSPDSTAAVTEITGEFLAKDAATPGLPVTP